MSRRDRAEKRRVRNEAERARKETIDIIRRIKHEKEPISLAAKE